MEKIKVFEMFSGYGGASFAFKKSNIPFECIGYSEIDKYAIQIYNQNHQNIRNYGNARDINPIDLPDFDLLTGGFPCQAFSMAGKREGFDDTRGTLFREIIRIAEIKKPKFMLLENVEGLVSHENGKTLSIILREIKRIGYGVVYKVLNSKDYGIPQSRERIWFVCKLGGWEFMEFMFPNPIKREISVKDLLEKDVDKKYFISKKMKESFERRFNQDVPQPTLLSLDKEEVASCVTTKAGGRYQDNFIMYSISNNNGEIESREDGNSPCLTQAMGMGGNKVPFVRFEKEGIVPCLKSTKDKGCATTPLIDDSKQNVNCFQTKYNEVREFPISPTLTSAESGRIFVPIIENNKSKENIVIPTLTAEHQGGFQTRRQVQTLGKFGNLRRLTPKECFRLMGFVDDNINTNGLSDTQLYKLAGNGWDINLVSKILKNLFKEGGKNGEYAKG